MANFAYVSSELTCPVCNAPVVELVAFQWGLCPGFLPRSDHIYNIGDLITWKVCSDGSIPPWTYFSDGSGNIGDPSVRNLVLLDGSEWNAYRIQKGCETCQQAFAGIAVKILDGVIRKAWLYSPSELDSKADIHLIDTDGALKPMPGWNDHSMNLMREC